MQTTGIKLFGFLILASTFAAAQTVTYPVNGGTGASNPTGYILFNGTSAATFSSTIPWGSISGAPTIPTVNAATQYAAAYYSGAGSSTTISGPTPFTGFGYFSTSAAPAAATATNLGALINLTGILYGNGTSAPTVTSAAQMISGFGSSIAANTLFANFTGSAAAPSFTSVPSCSGTGNGLNYTSGTGLGCPTFLTSTTGVTTFSAGTTGFTPSSATSGAITLAGTLNAVNGGTGEAGTITGVLYGNATSAHTQATAAQIVAGIGTTPVANATAANGLNSATTTVAVSSATAPTVGQVLQATSSTAATWQTPANAVGPSLASLYRVWNAIGSQVVRIENLGDSILTCNQQAPCTYGPQRIGSTFALELINELAQRYQQYSTGYRAIVRLSNGTTTVSAGDGYTLTSGTITNSTLLGPQESGVSLNGGSLLTFSSGAVLTIAVGQPYSSVDIACVQGTSISGYTVTINGSSVGTACGSGSGSATATLQNFANPVAQASQPATGSTLTLTALGATNYLYAYEGVLFCGNSQTACTTGFAVDNFGVGGASSPWFASGTKAGTGSAGMVWVNALPGKVALCVLENGENDANASSGVTSTQQNTQNQAVATACQTLGASVLFWVPPPYNSGGSPATYSALQQGSLTYCQNQGWACLNMADIFMGSTSGTLSGLFPFTAQDTGMGATPSWGVAQGLVTNSDSQHLNDCGELLATQQFLATVFPHIIFNYVTTGACSQNPQASATSSAYTNATTGFTTILGATANTGQLEFVAPINQAFTSVCRGYMQVGTTGIVDFQLIGSASISNINLTLSYQTTATSVYTMVSASALSSALATSSITAASGLKWVLEINGVNSTTSNSFAVQAHEASGTLTIPAGASCTTQLSGPQ